MLIIKYVNRRKIIINSILEKRNQSVKLIQNKFRRFSKKKALFLFAKKNKCNYSIYPSFLSENNNKKNNIKIKLYNDLLEDDYYILPLKYCNFRNCYVFDIPKNHFNSKSDKIIHFNFISNNNRVITDPNYDKILIADTYVNQIDFKKYDKKGNKEEDDETESASYSSFKDIDSEKEGNMHIKINQINLKNSNNSKLDNEYLLSNNFSNSTKDSFNVNSLVIKKIKKKRNKSILKNKEGSRSMTKRRENKSCIKRVSFGLSQISFYKSRINK